MVLNRYAPLPWNRCNSPCPHIGSMTAPLPAYLCRGSYFRGASGNSSKQAPTHFDINLQFIFREHFTRHVTAFQINFSPLLARYFYPWSRAGPSTLAFIAHRCKGELSRPSLAPPEGAGVVRRSPLDQHPVFGSRSPRHHHHPDQAFSLAHLPSPYLSCIYLNTNPTERNRKALQCTQAYTHGHQLVL